ncbi:membrane protein [Halobacillus andaensis]|uniref:Membrane protein n=1 Tax=Halobacillus andaensis TaxID=1176239 RepID=A0A917B6T0_HALAA|nr:YwiC-like family protein [Halobacillus andaensis]MBP2005768.1 hypothetical protein [Halobacillus andaensis]GGF26174.1 membrane protein [Halobacillus andaensis]
MKLLLPKQHGAWAMLIVPFLLGGAAGQFTLLHIPLFAGWFFLYLATHPLLLYMKGRKKQLHTKWGMAYLSIAGFFLLIVLLFEWRMAGFGVAMLPFFFINMYFAKQKKDRAFTNDIIAIFVFCIGGLASYYLGSRVLDLQGMFVMGLCFLFFLGSTFFIKSMIREKKNRKFRWYSWGYHGGLLLLASLVSGAMWVIPFIPSVTRAIMFYGKNLKVMQMGIIEVINSVYFLLSILVLMTTTG